MSVFKCGGINYITTQTWANNFAEVKAQFSHISLPKRNYDCDVCGIPFPDRQQLLLHTKRRDHINQMNSLLENSY